MSASVSTRSIRFRLSIAAGSAVLAGASLLSACQPPAADDDAPAGAAGNVATADAGNASGGEISTTGVAAPIGDIFSAGKVPVGYTADMAVPLDSRAAFIKWAVEKRGETGQYAGERWDRYQAALADKDLYTDADKRAFLLTPREAFVLPQNLARAYEHAFIDIGFGVTISGPHAVTRMTSALAIKPGDKVLEIGTGSGYQSAYLSHMTDQVWSIEIIQPLAQRTRAIYDKLAARGYTEFGKIRSKNADGYYGWPEAGPFDKIIVTCGIDHIPPPLLQQLKPGGIMVIPVGPPGAQHVLKIEKRVGPDGRITIVRSDIWNGRIVPFVPFTKLEGDKIVGSHNK